MVEVIEYNSRQAESGLEAQASFLKTICWIGILFFLTLCLEWGLPLNFLDLVIFLGSLCCMWFHFPISRLENFSWLFVRPHYSLYLILLLPRELFSWLKPLSWTPTGYTAHTFYPSPSCWYDFTKENAWTFNELFEKMKISPIWLL